MPEGLSAEAMAEIARLWSLDLDDGQGDFERASVAIHDGWVIGMGTSQHLPFIERYTQEMIDASEDIHVVYH